MTARPTEAQALQHNTSPRVPQTLPTGAPKASVPVEHFHLNQARVEGVIAKVWTYDGDVYARLAVYDRHTATLPTEPAENRALPRRQAHYLTLWLPAGATADGMAVSLQAKERVLITGHLRDRTYSESLDRLLKKIQRPERIQPGDETLFVGRSATYLVVETLVRLSA